MSPVVKPLNLWVSDLAGLGQLWDFVSLNLQKLYRSYTEDEKNNNLADT